MNWKTIRGHRNSEHPAHDMFNKLLSIHGLQESSGVLYALHFEEFINGSDLRVGLIRKLVGVRGTAHYLTLEEYNPSDLQFAISLCTDHIDPNTKYMIIRNHVTESPTGSVWNIEVKKLKGGFLSRLVGESGNGIDHIYHGKYRFS